MDNSVFCYMPPDVLRLLLNDYLPGWMSFICRMTCVAFRKAILFSPMRDKGTALLLQLIQYSELPLIEWAHSQGAPLDTWMAKEMAVRFASPPVFEWLLEKCYIQFDSVLDCFFAASSGNLGVLQFMHSRKMGCFRRDEAYKGFCSTGHIPVLQWLMQIDDTPLCFGDDFANLSTHGCFHALKWMYENRMLTKTANFRTIATNSAEAGHLDILRWVVKIYKNSDMESLTTLLQEDVARCAISGGFLAVLEYLVKEMGILPDSSWQTRATKWDCLHIVKWLHAQGCPWANDCCYWAASLPTSNTLKWIRQHGCPWGDNPAVGRRLLQYADQEVIDWARADGCPGL